VACFATDDRAELTKIKQLSTISRILAARLINHVMSQNKPGPGPVDKYIWVFVFIRVSDVVEISITITIQYSTVL
jgi:hypothetical protein